MDLQGPGYLHWQMRKSLGVWIGRFPKTVQAWHDESQSLWYPGGNPPRRAGQSTTLCNHWTSTELPAVQSVSKNCLSPLTIFELCLSCPSLWTLHDSCLCNCFNALASTFGLQDCLQDTIIVIYLKPRIWLTTTSGTCLHSEDNVCVSASDESVVMPSHLCWDHQSVHVPPVI